MAGTGASRTGDIGIGICPAHQTPVTYITTLVSSNPNVTADGIPIITVGDIGISTCGHATIALTGSTFGNINSKKIHRISDTGSNPGPYTVINGSSTVDSI